jgi:hypothetical protein
MNVTFEREHDFVYHVLDNGKIACDFLFKTEAINYAKKINAPWVVKFDVTTQEPIGIAWENDNE